MEGNTHYAISMLYKCNACGINCKGNDGNLFGHLPSHYKQGYNVDAKYAMGNKEKHLTIGASRKYGLIDGKRW